MTASQKTLNISGCISFALALLHLGCIFANEAVARFFAAPRWVLALVRERSLLMVPVAFAIAAVLTIFGLYALSGAGTMRRLPSLRAGLVTVGAIYTLRGLLIVPLLVAMVRYPGRVPPQFLAFSLVSLAVGIAYLAGTAGRWKTLSTATARDSAAATAAAR